MRTDKDGRHHYRAVVPVSYPIPADGPVGVFLDMMQRHNNRPAHLPMMFEATGYARLVTAVYPEGDKYLASDPVLAVEQSLIVKLETVNSDEEARKSGFPKGGSFKVLERDVVMRTEEAEVPRTKVAREGAKEVGLVL